MKVLFIPLILTLLTIVILFLVFNYWLKKRQISLFLKIVLGIFFFILGILASFYSMSFSIKGMADNNIKCATGSIVFIPLGILIYTIGIPSILFFKSKKVLE